MRLIRRKTTIPVPEVFAFDASLENELRCPFTLMELIHGKPLHDVWFEEGISQAMLEQKRIRSLHEIAEAMAQLNALTFSEGGSLLFDTKGDVVGIGSSNVVDFETQYKNVNSADYDNTMAFRQTGPFSDPTSYILSSLDAGEGECEYGIVRRGANKLLRLFVDWSLMDGCVQDKPFALAHPDLDSQNIFVNNDGSLAGIIDWDWISAVPHCIGPQSFPKFLMQDYDLVKYAYDVEAGRPMEGCIADSPAQLACYRAMYAQFMESYRSKNDWVNSARSRRHAAWVRKSRKEAADITRRSLITSTLQVAAKTPSHMKNLMVHLFDELEELTAPKWQEGVSIEDAREQEDAGEQEASEEDGVQEEETEASKVETADVVKEEPCIEDVRSDVKEDAIGHLSIDELLDEIEKLTGMSLAGHPKHDRVQDSADVEDILPLEDLAQPRIEAQDLGAAKNKKDTREPKAARVCGWLKGKLRRGAEFLYKKSNKDDLVVSEASAPLTRSASAGRTICGWTEKKLRRVTHCLHCTDDDKEKGVIESKIEAVQTGGVDVLRDLRTKLQQLREKLHCKGTDNSDSPEGGKEESRPNRRVTIVPKKLTRDEKRSVCRKFVHLIKDQNLLLTKEQQVAVSHWTIQMVQNPTFSVTNSGLIVSGVRHGDTEMDVQCQEGEANGGNSDAGDDSGYCGGDGDEEEKCADGGNRHCRDEGNNIELTDRARTEQPSDPSSSEGSDHLATETTSLEEELTEGPQPASRLKVNRPEEEDLGYFTLVDICVALAKDDLDEGRMERLREGFFGLLDQGLSV